MTVTAVRTVRATGFDYRRELGAHGYKYVPPAFRYLLAAARGATRPSGLAPEECGVVLGTNSAVAALHAGMDRTVVASGSDDLSPALAPYFSVNVGGGRLATDHGLKGFHATLTTPRVAGLEALALAYRAIALGRARWLLVAAAEDALDPAEPGASTSECGAVALVVHEGQSAVQVQSAFLPRGAPVPAMPRGMPVVAVLDDSRVGTAVAAALGPDARIVPAGAGCLEPLAQVAIALTNPEPTVVVAAAAEGNLAVAVVTPN